MTQEMMYDPPTGWRYGFPKVYRPVEGETVEDTLVRDGYPPKMAKGMGHRCRYWESPTEDTAARLAVEGAS